MPSLLCGVLLMAGCSQDAAEQSAVSEPVFMRHYRQGSLTVVVSVSNTNITTAGSLRFQVDIHVQPGGMPSIVDFESRLDPFTAASSYSEPVQELPNGKHLHRHVWTLVPSLPGPATLQSLEIRGDSSAVRTEPIRILVTSVLPEGMETLEIMDISEPIELLPQSGKRRRNLLILLSVLITAGFISGSIYIYRRPNKGMDVLPHDLAFEALEHLPQDELDRIHALIRILKEYLEKRFRIPASASTLKEMLLQLPDNMPSDHRQDLETFLDESDTIRFSNQIKPGFSAELEQFVRRFVDETLEVSECA